jgi:hypothetical protein
MHEELNKVLRLKKAKLRRNFFHSKEKSSLQRKKSVFCYKGLIPTFLLTTTLLQIGIIAVVLAVRTALQESSSRQAEE